MTIDLWTYRWVMAIAAAYSAIVSWHMLDPGPQPFLLPLRLTQPD